MFETVLSRFKRDQRGATAIEYGLIAALFAIIAIGGMTLFGGSLSGLFNRVSEQSAVVMSADTGTDPDN